MGIFIDLTGQRFGRWLVVERAKNRKTTAYWKCVCDCGTEREVREYHLIKRNTNSCGCLSAELASQRMGHYTSTHSLSKHRFFGTWRAMKQRCYSSTHIRFKDYGGRGITICDEWRDDPTYFLTWCDNQGSIPEGYSIDRIDVNGNYCPENCRFVAFSEQVRNKRNNIVIEYNGETLCLVDFVKKYSNVPYSTVTDRINKQGMTPLEAALLPRQKSGPKKLTISGA